MSIPSIASIIKIERNSQHICGVFEVEIEAASFKILDIVLSKSAVIVLEIT